ncbi:MAG: tRNA lysidine(34) synthetase TilS [SAR324 cluster bacterium]|nr:tRNA lysidine(34) synthetase TilS [SAR324 cluster bacterium]
MNYAKFIYQTREFALQQNLITRGDSLLISVSGGVDSVALLYFFQHIKSEFKLNLAVVHFDHQARLVSANDGLFVKELCHQLDIKYYSYQKRFTGNNFQANASKWRKSLLTELSKKEKFTKIALAHHLDDVAETVLWKIARGSSLFGLNAMKISLGQVIRPFMCHYKKDIIEYMSQQGYLWREDDTNQTNDYTRNLIRNKLLVELDKIGKGRITLLDLARDSAELEEIYEQMTKGIDISNPLLALDKLMVLPSLIAKELIGRYLTNQGVLDVNRAQIENLYREIKASSNRVRLIILSRGISAKIDKNWLMLTQKKGSP